jgi:hypothetical protein
LSLTQLSKINTGVGLNAVDAAGNYAYLANASTTNTQSSDELLVVNIGNLSAPTIVGRATLGITPNCPTFCPGGALSIYYYDGRVYVGTHRINGHDFFIFDVSVPSSPSLIRSIKTDHNINDVIVRGKYAYLATSNNTGEIMIYDISDPGPITLVGTFNTNRHTSDTEDATTLFLSGSTLYFGRERVNNSSERDFYMLDISNPAAPIERGSKNLALNPNAVVKGIVIKGHLAFVAIDDPNTGFLILNISNPSAVANHTTCTSINFSENTTALDMDGDYVFSANNSNDEIRVIADQGSSCTP